MGCALQCILSRAPYSEMSGNRHMEPDAQKIVPYTLLNVIQIPEVFKSLSSHHSSGVEIPDEQLNSMIRGQQLYRTYFYQIIDKAKQVIFSLWKIALSIWCMIFTWTTRIFDIEDIICIVYFSAQEHMQAIDVLNEAFKSALDLEFYLE